MNLFTTKTTKATGDGALANFERDERELAEVLGSFRLSVHAWSDAEFNRERRVVPAHRPLFGFRLAAASCVLLLAAGITGGVAVHEHNQDVAIQQARQDAEMKRKAAEQAQLKKMQQEQLAAHSVNDDALLADIDSDIAQESPEAMQPLASLMTR